MNNLFDTCTIIEVLKNDDNLRAVAEYCKNNSTDFTISDVILKELEKKTFITDSPEDENELYIRTKLYIDAKKIKQINVIDTIDKNPFKKNYDKIRKNYYDWMTNANYCKKLIKDGKLTQKEYQSPLFKTKDCGECSLIAIALTNLSEYTIISEDKGKVYKHPDINIFDAYKSKGVLIVTYDDWEHKDYIELN